MDIAAAARVARRSCVWSLIVTAGALIGCQSNGSLFATASQPEPAPEPAPVADDLSLFGEDRNWASPGTLPADPIPLTAIADSVDVSRVTYAEQGADFDPAMATDGAFMVFASTQHHHNADIYLKNTGSTVMTQLTDDPARDVMPAISPDGQWVAFASDRLLDWNVYIMPRAGGRPVQLTKSTAAELHPSWSPDGKLLAYSKLGQTSGKWEIWIVEVANTATPHFLGYGLFPEWCPKAGTGPTGGDLLLYQRSAERGDRAFGIWTLEYKDGDVGSPSQLIGSANTAYINPTWAPDGRFVVFAAVSNPHQVRAVDTLNHEDCDLWMLAADGTTLVNLTAGASTDLMPTWGNDGRIYFVSTRSGQDNIWSMDAREAMLAAGINPSLPYATVPTDQ
jgi:Tol biopolymer transport system component